MYFKEGHLKEDQQRRGISTVLTFDHKATSMVSLVLDLWVNDKFAWKFIEPPIVNMQSSRWWSSSDGKHAPATGRRVTGLG